MLGTSNKGDKNFNWTEHVDGWGNLWAKNYLQERDV